VKKTIQAQWQLQTKVDEIVRRFEPDCQIILFVEYGEDEIVRDEECEGFGLARWDARYIASSNDCIARDLMPSIRREISQLRERYDLGVTFG